MGIFSEDFYNATSNKSASKQTTEIPLLKDYAIDLETGQLLYHHNEPYIVEGIDAVICLAWKKLHTNKKNLILNEGYIIHTENYGNSLHTLKGKTKTYGDARIDTMLIDCLVDGTYITNVLNIQTTLTKKGNYIVNFTIATRYGAITGSVFIEDVNMKIMLYADSNEKEIRYLLDKH